MHLVEFGDFLGKIEGSILEPEDRSGNPVIAPSLNIRPAPLNPPSTTRPLAPSVSKGLVKALYTPFKPPAKITNSIETTNIMREPNEPPRSLLSARQNPAPLTPVEIPRRPTFQPPLLANTPNGSPKFVDYVPTPGVHTTNQNQIVNNNLTHNNHGSFSNLSDSVNPSNINTNPYLVSSVPNSRPPRTASLHSTNTLPPCEPSPGYIVDAHANSDHARSFKPPFPAPSATSSASLDLNSSLTSILSKVEHHLIRKSLPLNINSGEHSLSLSSAAVSANFAISLRRALDTSLSSSALKDDWLDPPSAPSPSCELKPPHQENVPLLPSSTAPVKESTTPIASPALNTSAASHIRTSMPPPKRKFLDSFDSSSANPTPSPSGDITWRLPPTQALRRQSGALVKKDDSSQAWQHKPHVSDSTQADDNPFDDFEVEEEEENWTLTPNEQQQQRVSASNVTAQSNAREVHSSQNVRLLNNSMQSCEPHFAAPSRLGVPPLTTSAIMHCGDASKRPRLTSNHDAIVLSDNSTPPSTQKPNFHQNIPVDIQSTTPLSHNNITSAPSVQKPIANNLHTSFAPPKLTPTASPPANYQAGLIFHPQSLDWSAIQSSAISTANSDPAACDPLLAASLSIYKPSKHPAALSSLSSYRPPLLSPPPLEGFANRLDYAASFFDAICLNIVAEVAETLGDSAESLGRIMSRLSTIEAEDGSVAAAPRRGRFGGARGCVPRSVKLDSRMHSNMTIAVGCTLVMQRDAQGLATNKKDIESEVDGDETAEDANETIGMIPGVSLSLDLTVAKGDCGSHGDWFRKLCKGDLWVLELEGSGSPHAVLARSCWRGMSPKGRMLLAPVGVNSVRQIQNLMQLHKKVVNVKMAMVVGNFNSEWTSICELIKFSRLNGDESGTGLQEGEEGILAEAVRAGDPLLVDPSGIKPFDANLNANKCRLQAMSRLSLSKMLKVGVTSNLRPTEEAKLDEYLMQPLHISRLGGKNEIITLEGLESSVIADWGLNNEQAAVISACKRWFQIIQPTNKKDEVTVHAAQYFSPLCVAAEGVFGAGKSTLLAALLEFLSKVLDASKSSSKVVLLGGTNCAVDGVVRKLLARELKVLIDSNKATPEHHISSTAVARVGRISEIHPEAIVAAVPTTKTRSLAREEFAAACTKGHLPRFVSNLLAADTLPAPATVWQKRRIVASTVASAITAPCLDALSASGRLGFVIVDEAAQLQEPQLFAALSRMKVLRLVLLGDTRQLPAVVKGPNVLSLSLLERLIRSTEENQKENVSKVLPVAAVESANCLKESLFEQTQQNLSSSSSSNNKTAIQKVHLNTQYRCHPLIANLCSALFYRQGLASGISPQDRLPLVPHWPPLQAILWQFSSSSASTSSVETRDGRSWSNRREALIVGDIFREALRFGLNPRDSGVVCLYKSHVNTIKQVLVDTLGKNAADLISVATVDAFQGAEKEVIVVSCVRTKFPGGGIIGTNSSDFVECPRRLNVALSRARRHMLLVASQGFAMGHPMWHEVVKACVTVPVDLPC